MQSMTCNILLLGQTGVGKSALVNYLAGKKLAETGIPLSVGGLTRGINKYPITLNGQKCMVSDSEGFEIQNSSFWLKLIEKELFKNDNTKPISDWYHIVIYCLSGAGARVQDFDLEIINRILDTGYGLIIAFTKSDISTNDDLKKMQDRIQGNKHQGLVKYVSVCSEDSYAEGCEEICSAVDMTWAMTLKNKLPSYIYDWEIEELKRWTVFQYKWIDTLTFGPFGNSSKDKAVNDLNIKAKAKVGIIEKFRKDRMKKAESQIEGINFALSSILNIDTIKNTASRDSLRFSGLDVESLFPNDSLLDHLLAALIPILGIFSVIDDVFFRTDNIREALKKGLDEGMNDVIELLKSSKTELKNRL